MSNVSWYDGCCSEEVVVFVSSTTTVCGSFVGAIDGGEAASSVVLQSIVNRHSLSLFLQSPGLSRRRIGDTSARRNHESTCRMCTTGTEESNQMCTHMYVMYKTGLVWYLTYIISVFFICYKGLCCAVGATESPLRVSSRPYRRY